MSGGEGQTRAAVDPARAGRGASSAEPGNTAALTAELLCTKETATGAGAPKPYRSYFHKDDVEAPKGLIARNQQDYEECEASWLKYDAPALATNSAARRSNDEDAPTTWYKYGLEFAAAPVSAVAAEPVDAHGMEAEGAFEAPDAANETPPPARESPAVQPEQSAESDSSSAPIESAEPALTPADVLVTPETSPTALVEAVPDSATPLQEAAAEQAPTEAVPADMPLVPEAVDVAVSVALSEALAGVETVPPVVVEAQPILEEITIALAVSLGETEPSDTLPISDIVAPIPEMPAAEAQEVSEPEPLSLSAIAAVTQPLADETADTTEDGVIEEGFAPAPPVAEMLEPLWIAEPDPISSSQCSIEAQPIPEETATITAEWLAESDSSDTPPIPEAAISEMAPPDVYESSEPFPVSSAPIAAMTEVPTEERTDASEVSPVETDFSHMAPVAEALENATAVSVMLGDAELEPISSSLYVIETQPMPEETATASEESSAEVVSFNTPPIPETVEVVSELAVSEAQGNSEPDADSPPPGALAAMPLPDRTADASEESSTDAEHSQTQPLAEAFEPPLAAVLSETLWSAEPDPLLPYPPAAEVELTQQESAPPDPVMPPLEQTAESAPIPVPASIGPLEEPAALDAISPALANVPEADETPGLEPAADASARVVVPVEELAPPLSCTSPVESPAPDESSHAAELLPAAEESAAAPPIFFREPADDVPFGAPTDADIGDLEPAQPELIPLELAAAVAIEPPQPVAGDELPDASAELVTQAVDAAEAILSSIADEPTDAAQEVSTSAPAGFDVTAPTAAAMVAVALEGSASLPLSSDAESMDAAEPGPADPPGDAVAPPEVEMAEAREPDDRSVRAALADELAMTIGSILSTTKYATAAVLRSRNPFEKSEKPLERLSDAEDGDLETPTDLEIEGMPPIPDAARLGRRWPERALALVSVAMVLVAGYFAYSLWIADTGSVGERPAIVADSPPRAGGASMAKPDVEVRIHTPPRNGAQKPVRTGFASAKPAT